MGMPATIDLSIQSSGFRDPKNSLHASLLRDIDISFSIFILRISHSITASRIFPSNFIFLFTISDAVSIFYLRNNFSLSSKDIIANSDQFLSIKINIYLYDF